jgi:Family of unknown function (DUF6151)
VNHPLQCRCGAVKGYVTDPRRVNRAVCYCRDCQAFAHFLGRAGDILDSQGGTDVIQTLPARVIFTVGKEALACMRLSKNGLMRWYTTCCKTPIGNTLPSFRFSFVGLIHNCLENAGTPLDRSFGPVRMWVNTKRAKGDARPRTSGAASGILRLLAMVARARIDGSYKRTAFFSADTGAPVAIPMVLSNSERIRLLNAL